MRIGLLSFAHVHAAGYASLLSRMPEVSLLCADPGSTEAPAGEVRGRDLVKQLGVDYVDTYDQVFAWEPDAVVICTENARHRDLTIRAAQAGVHVLCEKPLATTVQDGIDMVDACRRAGVILMTAYPVRFSPHFARLRELVDRGLLGSLVAATGTNNGQIPVGDRAWFTEPGESGGGSLVDHVVHVADLLDVLVGGRQATSVWAASNRILHADKPQVKAETAGLVSVTYPGGLAATIDCSWSQPDDAPTWGGLTLELVGTAGVASVDPFADHVGGYGENGSKTLWLGYGSNLDELMLESFLHGVRTGTHPQPDGEAGLRSLKVMVAAQESARSGEAVALS